MIDWTTVIVAMVAGLSAGIPAIIVALKTQRDVNGRMGELIEAKEKAAEARALLHERANNAHAILLHEALAARLLVKEEAEKVKARQ